MIDFLLVHPTQPFLATSEIEKQLPLRFGRSDFHDAPVFQNELMHFCFYPVHCKRYKPDPEFWVIALHCLHQSDIAFLDEIRLRKAVA